MATKNTTTASWYTNPAKPDIINHGDILNHIHQINIEQNAVLAIPDYSRRKAGYASRKRNGESSYSINIFKLHYPCYIVQQWYENDAYDSDLMLQFSTAQKTVSLVYASTVASFNAAKAYDSNYQIYLNLGSQSQSFLMPLGAIDCWYHYCSGAGGSSDDGDKIDYRKVYIIPLLNTPANTELVTFYSATATRIKESTSGEYVYVINSATKLKTIKA